MNKEKKIYTIATAHLDTFWLWTYEKSISTFIDDTLKENFRLFAKYPDYKFNFEGSHRYELMEEYYPEKFLKLKEYVAKGNWSPCGSCYENGDVNTPSPEALTRNILYGNGYFREKFGVESNDIFLPDCFGFGRALPSIAAHSGLTGFSTQKLTWGGAVDVPFDIGRWTGKDGKGLWCALKPGNYVSVAGDFRKNENALKNLKENTEKYSNPRTFVYHGTGDRGGAPAEKSVRNIFKSMKKNAENDIKVLFSSTKEFFDDMENLTADEKSHIPVYNGELLLTEHGAGSYTSRTVTKRWNRRCELLADAAERFSVAAFTNGVAEYPQKNLDSSWKRVIAHQFHDDITGTSFESCYKRSHTDYVQAMNTFSSEYTASLGALSSLIDTSFVKGTAVVVSNPVQNKGKRLGAVSADIEADGTMPYVRVYNNKGAEVPSQKTLLENGKIRVSFLAEVSSCGVAVYDVRFSDEKSDISTDLKVTSDTIENKNIKITIDKNGDIASVYNKISGVEALKESIRLAVLHDVDSNSWPAWEVKLSDLSRKPYMYPSNPVVTIVEEGSALCKIRIDRKAGKSLFTQWISLDCESEYVSVENEVDWREEASLLKAEFRTTATNEKAQYDIGFGYTERDTNTKRLFEVPAQKWAGITDKNDSFGTAVFSDSRSGWDKPDSNTVRLTCIHTPLNSYRWECSQHLMDLGINRFGFAVYPHDGQTDKIIANADEFCQKMHTFVTDKHSGKFEEYSAVKINCDNVRISALKKAQDNDSVIIRICEYTGAKANGVEIEFPQEIKLAYEVRGDEVRICEFKAQGNKLCLDMDENEIRSFAVDFDTACAFETTDKCLELPFNAVAITSNKNRSASTLKGGVSVPSELVNDKIISAGTVFEMPKGETNGLICNGQKLQSEKDHAVMSLLLTSLNGDKNVTFKSGAKEYTFKVQDAFESVGHWDLMASKQLGYIKPVPQALTFTHSHNKTSDAVAKQMYFFKVDIPVVNGDEITLPKDEDILILSATLVKAKNVFIKADEHFDSLEKRKFDYEFSSYAIKASKPMWFEPIIDKIIDRTACRTFVTGGGCSKISLGDAFYAIREIGKKLVLPKVRDERLKR